MKISISFLAGALSVAIAVFFSAGHYALLMFALGVFSALCGLLVGLGSVDRIRRVSGALSAFAEALEGFKKPLATPRVSRASVLPSRSPELSGVGADVCSALQNQGERARVAEEATRAALEIAPHGDLTEVYRLAVQQLRTLRQAA